MIKLANEKRVQLQVLQKVDYKISSSTRWNDRVDSLTTIAKIARVNVDDVSMEQKKRRVKEADPSRRLDPHIRSGFSRKVIKLANEKRVQP